MSAIYFILAAEINRIKIGVAGDVWNRFSKVQSDCPCDLTLMAFEDGGIKRERALHKVFAADRYRGEWFTYSIAIRDYVASLPPAVKPVRDTPGKDIVAALGISKSHASTILSGKYGSRKLAIQIYRATGRKVPRIAALSDEDIDALERIEARAA